MTSSTTRAFMAKKQSTSFAQVATNLLNVLQGYTKGIRFVAVLTMLLTLGIGHLWAADVTWTINGVQTTANNTIVNTALKTSSVTPNTEKGVWTAKSTNNSYAGFNSGAQLGASSNREFKGTITLSNTSIPASATITAIKITGRSNGTYTISAKVGENSFGSTITFSSSTDSEKSINGSIVGNSIVLTVSTSTASKYLGISKIVVSYTAKLATPTNLKVADVTTTSATLSWDAVTNASGYTVTVGSTPYSANTNSISLNSLTPSTTYKWSVVAKGNGSTYTDSESAKGSDFTTDTPQKYTVTWMVDKETLSTEDVYEDGKVSSVPTVNELPCGDKFVGWTDTPIQTPQNEAPDVFTTVADSPTITKATTFYAVFADYEQ